MSGAFRHAVRPGSNGLKRKVWSDCQDRDELRAGQFQMGEKDYDFRHFNHQFEAIDLNIIGPGLCGYPSQFRRGVVDNLWRLRHRERGKTALGCITPKTGQERQEVFSGSRGGRQAQGTCRERGPRCLPEIEELTFLGLGQAQIAGNVLTGLTTRDCVRQARPEEPECRDRR